MIAVIVFGFIYWCLVKGDSKLAYQAQQNRSFEEYIKLSKKVENIVFIILVLSLLEMALHFWRAA